MFDILDSKIHKAGEIIKKARHVTAFTGAGISVESGVPPFRGEGGIWEKYDPQVLDLSYFHKNPGKSWITIREIFYNFFGKIEPNDAHIGLAKLEEAGILKAIITQNIDGLHARAGSKIVHELHGTLETLVCTKCGKKIKSRNLTFKALPLYCDVCQGLIKPDFIFFGEALPTATHQKSQEEAENADVFILIGTTGKVMPAALLPHQAKSNNCKIIEINTEPSDFTNSITDIFLKGKATEMTNRLVEKIVEDGWQK